MASSITYVATVAIAITTGIADGSADRRDEADDSGLLKEARSRFQRLPKDMTTPEFPVTPERVRLGRTLFLHLEDGNA